MGLDSVELVMAFEDYFEIAIANDDAEKLQTVGDVTDFVLEELAARERPRPREVVFEQVCAITCEQCGARRDQLTEATSFIDDLGLA